MFPRSKLTNYGVAVFVTVILLISTGLIISWHKRPPRSPLTEPLFAGVEYTRQIVSTPRPLIIHIITIDLNQENIKFLVTPGEREQTREHQARTTTEFVEEFQVQVAINGSFFAPFYGTTPFHYYPHSGDPVDARGLTISNGVVYSHSSLHLPTLCITPTQVVIQNWGCTPETRQAISGDPYLILAGQIMVEQSRTTEEYLHPRTAIGLDKIGQTLWLIVADGRQPGYSEGVTLYELSEIMIDLGVAEALNLDGGGSTTLVVNRAGQTEVLNAPYHTHIRMRERPVANHFGVYAAPLQ